MYWLLPQDDYSHIRNVVTALTRELALITEREQRDQVFPFNGRKDRRIARTIIRYLSSEADTVCDPFGGAGIFAYAALDENRRILYNEWEPYAFRLSTSPFRPVPSAEEINGAIEELDRLIGNDMRMLYRTICPRCNRVHVMDGLFYDREPEEYFIPTPHERLGPTGENIIFRRRIYKCDCGNRQKHFDDTDLEHLRSLNSLTVDFPNTQLIENSRINFSAPNFTTYGSLFPHRSKLALMLLYNAIQRFGNSMIRDTMLDAFLTIIPLAKYTDYRCKSQDPHCPPNRLKENNIYHRFIEQLQERVTYLREQGFVNHPDIGLSCRDFRIFLQEISHHSLGLILTDPPYGDSAPYFELAQRYHPFINYSLAADTQRLRGEVVISNAPSRTDKHDRGQFLRDIESIFESTSPLVRDHGYLALYFRPEQSHWIADLNRLKLFGRKHGFEPLISVDVGLRDPSMRVLASTAWTFARDICFIFLKLNEAERRWYEGDTDVDEIIYMAARDASGERGHPFTRALFNSCLLQRLRQHELVRLSSPQYNNRIENTLLRFCTRQAAQYILSGESPYELMNFGVDPELRMREFVPIVIEELSSNGDEFSFEEFIIRLASYLDNGNRSIIARLHQLNQLIPILLNHHAELNETETAFRVRTPQSYVAPQGRRNILSLSPSDFEELIAEYLRRRGYQNPQVVGRPDDRGVDIIAYLHGELHLVQCKRYRPGNNIGSAPIQRLDSYRRSRNAQHAIVVTTSEFTPAGENEASITGVSLINGHQLQGTLEIYFPGEYFVPQE